MDEQINNFKLKRQYRLGIADENNYILAYNGYKCVFLNPISAFILKCVLTMPYHNAKIFIGEALGMTEIESKSHIDKLTERLSNYLEVDNKDREYVEDLKNELLVILNQKKNYVCPVQKSRVPRKVKFYLTDYCPRQCIYCFAGAKYSKVRMHNSDFLSVDRFKTIIKEADQIGVKEIEISGGDPFAVDNIFDYISVMIKYFSGDWSVSTKALLTKQDINILKTIGLREMQVSIDSSNPSTADKLMGVRGAFNEVVTTIDNIIEVGITLCTNTVITSLNIFEVPELFDFLIKKGTKYIRFSYYYMSGNRHKDLLFPSNEQFKWLNEKMKPLVIQAREKGIYTDFYPHDANIKQNNEKNRSFCGGFTDAMSVRYDGGVLFCDSLNHCEDFISGNLKQESILEAWNSPASRNMNDPDYFYERYRGTRCYTCHMFRNCFYKRCYVRTYNEYGRYFDIDPACPFGNGDYVIKS